MNIVVLGNSSANAECRAKFGQEHRYFNEEQLPQIPAAPDNALFIFNPASSGTLPDHFKTIFFNTSATTLRECINRYGISAGRDAFGFAGLPGLLHRELLEISLNSTGQLPALEIVCRSLGTKFQVVGDRVGMITPRVICMIINEAYFAASEGTASRSDIDSAMKTGTNYPWGPFEWSKRIGLKNVVALLTAVQTHTRDERYAVCTLLQEESLTEKHLPSQ